ncbi:hypothetical protein LY78DRAFT_664323 [Colletotrichum sublineola]|nr:hypothetical protein LY78DRAFT_664323 [Colletotrichum sublineola]
MLRSRIDVATPRPISLPSSLPRAKSHKSCDNWKARRKNLLNYGRTVRKKRRDSRSTRATLKGGRAICYKINKDLSSAKDEASRINERKTIDLEMQLQASQKSTQELEQESRVRGQ